MPRLKCPNKECLNSQNEINLQRLTMIMSEGTLVPKKPIKCEWCNTDLVIIKEDFNGVPGYNKFDSMSDTEKKTVLAKRSKEHYNKQGKEQKRANFKKIIGNL